MRDQNDRMMTRPLLLVDIDGVLNPYIGESALPRAYSAHQVGGMTVALCAEHGRWLHELQSLYDLVWASTWEGDANALIGQRIGAPPELPHLTFVDRDPQDWIWKLPAVQRFVGARSVAWLDDEPGHGAAAWAEERTSPTLLLRPDSRLGWTRAEFDQLVAFATSGDA